VKKKLLLIQPGAWGDIFLCMPIADFYSDTYEIYWPVRTKYMTLQQYFPYVNFIEIKSIYDKPGTDWLRNDVVHICDNLDIGKYDKVLNLADRGPHPTAERWIENFEECKYRLAGVPWEKRFSHRFIRDTIASEDLFNLQVGNLKEYVFVHIRNSKGEIALMPDGVEDVIIYCREIKNYTIIDWYDIIVNAKAIYCMESAVHQFITSIAEHPSIKNIPKFLLHNRNNPNKQWTISEHWNLEYF
jgi:hypothetical protein